jgi:hypothetical protein
VALVGLYSTSWSAKVFTRCSNLSLCPVLHVPNCELSGADLSSGKQLERLPSLLGLREVFIQKFSIKPVFPVGMAVYPNANFLLSNHS